MPKFGMSKLAPALEWPKYFYQGFNRQYFRKVLGYRPTAFWPLWEASGSVAFDASANGNNGVSADLTLGEIGIGDGRSCSLFDGAASHVDVYSAGLASVFNGAAGTIALWSKISAGVWTDETSRRLIWLYADGNNRLDISRAVVDNRLQFVYKAGGTSEVVNSNDHSETGFFHAAMTWDKVADAVKTYFNGAQVGTTQTGLGTWLGALAANNNCIGAQTNAPITLWAGHVAHVALFDKALVDTVILDLSTV